jgi:hypothetical protein
VEIGRSERGYLHYLLRFVERPPIPEIKEDWFAGFEIRVVAEKSLAAETLAALQTDPLFRDLGDEKWKERLDEAIARLFHAVNKPKPSGAKKSSS